MDDDDDAPEDTRRVRILSTLESTRQATRPSRTKGGRRTRQSPSHRRSWLQGALWGAMGVGVVALLAGFVMVIQDGKPALAHTSTQPAVPQAKAVSDTALTKVASLPPVAAGPAVIETATVSATPGPMPAAAPVSAAPLPAPNPSGSASRAEKVTPTVTTTSPSSMAQKAASKGQDEDVALLEAMFAHTGRKAVSKQPANPKN